MLMEGLFLWVTITQAGDSRVSPLPDSCLRLPTCRDHVGGESFLRGKQLELLMTAEGSSLSVSWVEGRAEPRLPSGNSLYEPVEPHREEERPWLRVLRLPTFSEARCLCLVALGD